MIGQKIATFTVACLAVFADAKSARLPNPRTWMQDAANPHLSKSLSEFFAKVQEDQVEEDEEGLFHPIGNHRVKVNDDILVSDYISVNYWYWDQSPPVTPDENKDNDENKDENEEN